MRIELRVPVVHVISGSYQELGDDHETDLSTALGTPWYLRTTALLLSSRALSPSDTARTIGTDWFVTTFMID